MRISELARIIGSTHLQQPDYTLFPLLSCATNGVHLCPTVSSIPGALHRVDSSPTLRVEHNAPYNPAK